MEFVNVFTDKFQKTSSSCRSVQLESSDKEEPSSSFDDRVPKNEKILSCSYCRTDFSDCQAQREHYKLDWHRYNLKQSLLSKQPISEQEFNEKTNNDDLSSISGSDSDEKDTLDMYATAQGKIFLQNDENLVFSLYRCLLCDKKEEVSAETLQFRLRDCCVDNKKWTILMLGGGHFAGAIFQGTEPILHKTFHCYTVRAGQGGTQSSRDSKSGGPHPKSAGASLRRYNEQALVQHVRSIVETWKPEIDKSSLIIYRASGPYNRSVLFGGSPPLLDRSNKNLRTIPFSTRRATFAEVKRVHGLLSTAEVYDSLEKATENFSRRKSPEAEIRRIKFRSSCINRAKSRETVERPLPTALSSASSSESINNNVDITTNDLEVSFKDLKEFDDSLTPEQRKKVHKKKKPKKSKTKKLKEQEEARKKELIDTIKNGDLEKLNKLLENFIKSSAETENSKTSKEIFINQIIDDSLNTLLHVAAIYEQKQVLTFLLENDANPCLKNKNQYTVYTCTQCKGIRESLKHFARENPEKYNYNKAQIPMSALDEKEASKKRKVKKEKEKERKKENEIKRKDEQEKDRFLRLSDREKRALAAERRIRDQSGKIIVRCFQCAKDITGKVPFEYNTYLFCSVDCLKIHRTQHSLIPV